MAIGIGPRAGVMVMRRIYGKGSNTAYFQSKVLFFMGTQKEMVNFSRSLQETRTLTNGLRVRSLAKVKVKGKQEKTKESE